METKHPSLALESGTYCTCREMSILVAFCNYGCCQTGVRVSFFFYKQCFNAFSSHNFVFYLPCIYTHLKCCFFCLNLALTFPASLFFFPIDLLLFCLNLTESSYEGHIIMSCIQKSYLVHLFQKKHWQLKLVSNAHYSDPRLNLMKVKVIAIHLYKRKWSKTM